MTEWVWSLGISTSTVRRLSGGHENDSVLIVEAASHNRIVLRRSPRRTRAAVDCEIEFIHAAARAGVNVAVPLPIFDGDCSIDSPLGVVAAFSYVEGQKRMRPSSNDVYALARLLPSLHDAGIVVGADQRRGYRPFGDRIHGDLSSTPHGLASLGELRRLHSAVDAMYEDGCRKDAVIVHGDLHPGNVLWSPAGEPTVIDFDDCYLGTHLDECFAAARGYGFSASVPRVKLLRHLLGAALHVRGMRITERLAAECSYFYSAMLDSAARSGRALRPRELIDLRRALACLQLDSRVFR